MILLDAVSRLRGLRGRVMLAFSVGALLISATFAVSTYLIARGYLLSQRERTVVRQAQANATSVSERMGTAGAQVQDVLTSVDPPAAWTILVRHDGRWFSSSLDVSRDVLPAALVSRVERGEPASVRVRVAGRPRLVVGVPLSAARGSFYEIAPLDELESTLRILSGVLTGSALLATCAGALLGLWASGRVVRPLEDVASTAVQIASGRLDTRLAATDDPDLAIIVGSFNSMVDSLQERIERDARFVADVSHELRSPLTTLTASMDVLKSRIGELPPRSRQAVELIEGELQRFRRLLDNLLELARADADPGLDDYEPVSVAALLRHTLTRSGRPESLLTAGGEALIRGDKLRLERAFVNLLDNADRHGGGLLGVCVAGDDGQVTVAVEDSGPGVPPGERDRIFERFATGRTARRSRDGTGLGLALTQETVIAHGGTIWCEDRSGGGARFVVSLPEASP